MWGGFDNGESLEIIVLDMVLYMNGTKKKKEYKVSFKTSGALYRVFSLIHNIAVRG